MILITGGAGYIGSHINKELHKEGYDTIVLDSLENGYEDAVKWGEFIECDLANLKEIDSIFNKFDIKGVMHFAGYTSVGESVEFPAKYYKNNYKNTLGLLKVMKDYSINKFIFSSTAAVYGNPIKTPITEIHPLNPINPYGKSKLMVELTLERESKLKSSEFKYSALRYFNASGADVDGEIGERHTPETHLIPLILEVANGKIDHISIFGDDYDTPDGTCIRDYIHVTDLAQAHIKAYEYLSNEKDFNNGANVYNDNDDDDNYNINVNSNNKNNDNNIDIKSTSKNHFNIQNNFENVFNLGNGNGFSVKEVIDVCENVTGIKIKRKILPRREGDPAILIADSKKAKDVLKWNPEFSNLEKIVETAWNWHEKTN